MAILPIYLHPHPVLAQEAKPVAKVTPAINQLLDDMMETLLDRDNGVGLAANQVGQLHRVLVLNFSDERLIEEIPLENSSGKIKMINPEIVWQSETISSWEEGCFSVPLVFTDVERPAQVTINYLNEEGKPQAFTTKPNTLFNHCVQHEIDHLDGIVFPERVSRLKRTMVMKKYNKLAPDFDETLPYKHIGANE